LIPPAKDGCLTARFPFLSMAASAEKSLTHLSEFDRLQRQFDSSGKRARAMIEGEKRKEAGKKRDRREVREDAKTDHNRGSCYLQRYLTRPTGSALCAGSRLLLAPEIPASSLTLFKIDAVAACLHKKVRFFANLRAGDDELSVWCRAIGTT